MIFTQLLTLGLLTLAVGGGALGGYLMRIRQEATTKRKVAYAIRDERNPVINVKPVKSDPS
jgi:hypothetical protein